MTNNTDSKAPAFVGTDDQLRNSLEHMLTRRNLTLSDKAAVSGALDFMESAQSPQQAAKVLLEAFDGAVVDWGHVSGSTCEASPDDCRVAVKTFLSEALSELDQ